VEFELGWAAAPFGDYRSKKYSANPCGGFDMPRDFQDWAISHGHEVIYAGKASSPFAKWHFSLDGEVYLELVSDPLTFSELKDELQLVRSAVTHSGKDLVEKFLRVHFDRAPAYASRSDLYDWFECHVSRSLGPRTKLFPNSQTTTTLTDAELTTCTNPLVTSIHSYFKMSPLAVLQATTYVEGAKLRMPYLIKHAAEQFTTTVPASVTALGGAIDKVDVSMGLHTSANKLAPIFLRGGAPAYVIEVRAKSDPVNVAIMDVMNGSDMKAALSKLEELLVCKPPKAAKKSKAATAAGALQASE